VSGLLRAERDGDEVDATGLQPRVEQRERGGSARTGIGGRQDEVFAGAGEGNVEETSKLGLL
jgi:hypothetical protein